MRSTSVYRSGVQLLALTVGLAFSLLLSVIVTSSVASACPVRPTPLEDPCSFVWIDLKTTPSNIPMDLVSFYDRTSGLQFAAWVGLLVLGLVSVALTIERALNYSRASRQTRRFMSFANEALVCEHAESAVRLASNFPSSPVACVVTASLTLSPLKEFQFSTAARQIAATAKTAEVVRGLATLGAIAMTAPIIGAAAAVDGLIRCLRVSSVVPISSDVLQNWMADWLLGLLAGLILGLAATWAHRILAAKANRLLLEMDRLSLAIISGATISTDRTRAKSRLLPLATAEISRLVTRAIGN